MNKPFEVINLTAALPVVQPDYFKSGELYWVGGRPVGSVVCLFPLTF